MMTFPDISLFLACNRITHAKQKKKQAEIKGRDPPEKKKQTNTNESCPAAFSISILKSATVSNRNSTSAGEKFLGQPN